MSGNLGSSLASLWDESLFFRVNAILAIVGTAYLLLK